MPEHYKLKICHCDQLSKQVLALIVMMAEDQGVKLLTVWASPFAMRVVFALETKGAKYESVPEDLGNKSKLLLESNPVHKKVPVLLHDGKPICDSTIIVQYVDETWSDKAPFFPKDPYGRAKQRFWADFLDKKVMDSAFEFIKTRKTNKESAASANKAFLENCKIFESELAKTGPFFGGKSVSYVDVVFSPLAVWLPAVSKLTGLQLPSKEEYPRFHELMQALLDTPAGKAALPDPAKLEEFYATIPFYSGARY